jgi:hypothetical protein
MTDTASVRFHHCADVIVQAATHMYMCAGELEVMARVGGTVFAAKADEMRQAAAIAEEWALQIRAMANGAEL